MGGCVAGGGGANAEFRTEGIKYERRNVAALHQRGLKFKSSSR